MDKVSFILLLLAGFSMIWLFHGLWTNPKEFMEKANSFRAYFFKGPSGDFIKKLYGEESFNNPNLEIFLGRIAFIVIMLGIILTLYSMMNTAH